jgi:hypothetical protein
MGENDTLLDLSADLERGGVTKHDFSGAKQTRGFDLLAKVFKSPSDKFFRKLMKTEAERKKRLVHDTVNKACFTVWCRNANTVN